MLDTIITFALYHARHHNLIEKYGSVTALDGLNLEVHTDSVIGLSGALIADTPVHLANKPFNS